VGLATELGCVEEVFVEAINDSMNTNNFFSISAPLYWLFYTLRQVLKPAVLTWGTNFHP
jgi:hypothetical protein